MNPKLAQCLGQLGYGNGYYRNNYCKEECKYSKECAVVTFDRVWEKQTKELRYFEKCLDVLKSWRKAIRRFVAKYGKPDPYFEQIIENTGLGFSDSALMKTGKRQQMRGGVWFYNEGYLRIENEGRAVGKTDIARDLQKGKVRDTSKSSGTGGERESKSRNRVRT